MNRFATLRGAFLAASVAVGALAAGPVLAAPEDVALLQNYIGSWRATGTVTGPKGNSESAACRLVLTDGNGDKVNFSGRCSLSGTAVTLNGTVVFAEETQQYEAVMSTSVGFTGQAIGVRQGNSIRFDLHEAHADEEGNNMTVSSSFTFSGGAINIGIEVLFADSGDKYTAAAPFSR